MKGKIMNFTLKGNVLTLKALGSMDEGTLYKLSTNVDLDAALTYEGLVRMLEGLKSDIEDVLKFGTTYVEDKDGHFIANGNGVRNEFVEKFEDMWHDEA